MREHFILACFLVQILASCHPFLEEDVVEVGDYCQTQTRTCMVDTDGDFYCKYEESDFWRRMELDDIRALSCQYSYVYGSQGRVSLICALDGAGRVYCLGATLEDGPTQVGGFPALPVSIEVGGENACALLADHSVWCWGDNSLQQLGRPDPAVSMVPLRVEALGATVSKLAAGADYYCATTLGNQLWCWGRNLGFQPDSEESSVAPVPVESFSSPVTSLDIRQESDSLFFMLVATTQSGTLYRRYPHVERLSDGWAFHGLPRTIHWWSWNYDTTDRASFYYLNDRGELYCYNLSDCECGHGLDRNLPSADRVHRPHGQFPSVDALFDGYILKDGRLYLLDDRSDTNICYPVPVTPRVP